MSLSHDTEADKNSSVRWIILCFVIKKEPEEKSSGALGGVIKKRELSLMRCYVNVSERACMRQ